VGEVEELSNIILVVLILILDSKGQTVFSVKKQQIAYNKLYLKQHVF
jgi:hypothetical protein